MPPKKQSLTFKVSSGLKDIIGRDLITDDNIAIFELVKNAYDAHATFVQISFIDINTEDPTILIVDNGKGMNHGDLINKWLIVGYSAKKEGTEDSDYRNKISQGRVYAGAKGIGRFSCDRLGRFLRLETIKDEINSKKETLEIDWTKFEESLKDNFVEIKIRYVSSELQSRKNHGTKLIISDLRSIWNRPKLLELKKSLSKLISPQDDDETEKFKIEIFCPDEEVKDAQLNENNKINGEIKNFIFEELEIKTTKITVIVDRMGEFITTELLDGGTLIYKIKEKNPFSKLLHSVSYKIFYLNKAAKDIFKRRMGVRTREYGSIFVYKNNIRIYPYGEFNDDTFNLDKRKAQKPSIFLGNKDIIGRVEVTGKNEQFKETSSRGNGFINNETYKRFYDVFENFVITRLEKYVIDVQKWGEGSYLSIEDENLGENKKVLQNRITSLISKISNSSEIVDINYDENILSILDEKQSESALSLVGNLFRIAKDSSNKQLLKIAEKTKIRVEELREALAEAQKEAEKNKKQIEDAVSENLFLKSIKSQDLDEIVSFVHHIGISASVIDNYLNGIYKRINRGQEISQEKFKDIVQDISFENRKIMSIAKFATKANFILFTEEQKLDVVEYIREYILNVLHSVQNQSIDVQVASSKIEPFLINTRPIELNILIDNFLSNAKKAKATTFIVGLKRTSNSTLQISFKDNGIGIPPENISRIFDFGFTTTSGSGLGLFHAKKIAERLDADLTIRNNSNNGVEVLLTLNKN